MWIVRIALRRPYTFILFVPTMANYLMRRAHAGAEHRLAPFCCWSRPRSFMIGFLEPIAKLLEQYANGCEMHEAEETGRVVPQRTRSRRCHCIQAKKRSTIHRRS